ncbi:MAG: transcription termination factor Rho [Eubacteriaceae bacterium]
MKNDNSTNDTSSADKSDTLDSLREKAKELGIKNISKLKKAELTHAIEDAEKRYSKLKDRIGEAYEEKGTLQILPEGFGFLKNEKMTSPEDYVYVSASQIQRFKLNTGDAIMGKVRPPKDDEKYYAMLFLENVNGVATSEILKEEERKMQNPNAKDMKRYECVHVGILDIMADGFGFLRKNNYLPGEDDIYVSPHQIKRYRLRRGDEITGKIRIPNESERFDALLYVDLVNGKPVAEMQNRANFERLIPEFPDDKIVLETSKNIQSTRIMDIFCPVGKGQRGMIVAAPKVGKTILLKEIANAISKNYPEIKLIVLLVDERPEEVTDIVRSVKADVVFSTFDQPSANHIKAAEMVLERSKRLVEIGKDVVVLMDSMTRFARANNLVIPPSGRTLSGGLDPEALYLPKKFFGAARNISGGGSLTILATALVDTGSRMDDIIFEEFKGTGNMEIHLERDLAEKRIFPAIDIYRSGTRREDLLLSEAETSAAYILRKLYASAPNKLELTEKIINIIGTTDSNKDFINLVIKKYANN